jgi:hypothetical protein
VVVRVQEAESEEDEEDEEDELSEDESEGDEEVEESEEEIDFVVEGVEDVAMVKGRILYRVVWEGDPTRTWEPTEIFLTPGAKGIMKGYKEAWIAGGKTWPPPSKTASE